MAPKAAQGWAGIPEPPPPVHPNPGKPVLPAKDPMAPKAAVGWAAVPEPPPPSHPSPGSDGAQGGQGLGRAATAGAPGGPTRPPHHPAATEPNVPWCCIPHVAPHGLSAALQHPEQPGRGSEDVDAEPVATRPGAEPAGRPALPASPRPKRP